MRKFKTNWRWQDLVFLAILVKLFYWLYRCCKKKRPADTYTDADYIYNQLLVLRKDGVSPQQLADWAGKKLTPKGITLKQSCVGCDDSLQLWEGVNVPDFISDEHVASGGISKGKDQVQGGGQNNIAFYSFNISIRIPQSVTDRGKVIREGKPLPDYAFPQGSPR